MLQTTNENNIQCNTCMKRDVCKYQEEYVQTFKSMQKDVPYLNDIFTIELKCNKAVCHILTNSGEWPSHMTLLDCGTGIRHVEPTVQNISSNGGCRML